MNMALAFERKLKCSRGMLTAQDNSSRSIINGYAISNQKANIIQMFDGRTLPIPKAALCIRINIGIRELLIQWEGSAPEDKTWEPFDKFRGTYPEFELEDNLNTERGSDAMDLD